MSKQAPMLMDSPLTERVYVVTDYTDNNDGTFTARNKYDVTEQFDALVKSRLKHVCTSEYIFEVPDFNQPIGDVYYQAEDDDPMPVHEKIVRCKDCKHSLNRFERMFCMRDNSCDEIAIEITPDGFCAWGDKRKVGE